MKLQFRSASLPFEYPFTISNGRTKDRQPALLVSLGLGNLTGYGEAPAITYYRVTVDEMIEKLSAKQVLVEKFALTEPDRWWHYLHHLFPATGFPGRNFLICALDMAGWDLYGKLHGKPLHSFWPADRTPPPTDYTLGIDSAEKMIAKMKAHPWPIYKIKVGTADDIALVRAIRQQTDAPLRVDANAGWTLEQAMNIIPQLAELGVELVEQPLEKGNDEGMEKLFSFSPLPLFADESCVEESDVKKCVGRFHGINIKLTKCGGITPALRMIKEARELGLRVMMGSMNESTIGSAAVAHFLPQLDFVDMDGTLLLKGDYASGLSIDRGHVKIPDAPGLGIQIKDYE